VELLVVVAIISVLAAMLLPALQNAMQAAYSTSCASQMRQLDLVFSFYREDHDGEFPIIRRGAGWHPQMNWPALLATAGVLEDEELLHCPGFTGKRVSIYEDLRWGTKHFGRISVGVIHGSQTSWPSEVGFRPEAHVKNASEELFAVDSTSTKSNPAGDSLPLAVQKALMGGPYGDPPDVSGEIRGWRGTKLFHGSASSSASGLPEWDHVSIRHGYRSNAIFWDGHVRAVAGEELWIDSLDGANPDCIWDGY